MTDPEELRNRAVSIFAQLRQRGTAPVPPTTPADAPAGGDHAEQPEHGVRPDDATDDKGVSGSDPTPTTAGLAGSARPGTEARQRVPAQLVGHPDPDDPPEPGTAAPAPTDRATAEAGLREPTSEDSAGGHPPTQGTAGLAGGRPESEVALAPVDYPRPDGTGPTGASPTGLAPVSPADLPPRPADRAEPGRSEAIAGEALVDDPMVGEAIADVAAGQPARRPLPRILAIANQKGGVGKTTTAVNLGAALAELGYRVLVIDLDPQGNATTGLGINARNLDGSIYDVLLHDVPIEDCIEPTSLRNLFVVPATIDLAGAEIELVPVFSRELRLRRAVQHVIDDFDFVIIDCPPSLGLLTVNGLSAATEVVVPIQCEYFALEGLGQLLRNVDLVQSNLNPGLEVTTIILTMYDARTRLAEQVVADVRAHFGDRVCRNVVPRTVRLSEAPSFGQPIILFDSSSRGAHAYRELAKEVSGGAPQRVG